MTTDLCRDVERLIIDKAEKASTVMYAVYRYVDGVKNEESELMFYLTRSMWDPAWHVQFHADDTSVLCRTRNTLEYMVQQRLGLIPYDDDDDDEQRIDSDFIAYLRQNHTEPPPKTATGAPTGFMTMNMWCSFDSMQQCSKQLMKEIENVVATV